MNEPEKQAKPRYRLYIDESGDHTYKLLEDPAHRYLSLLGVWIEQNDEYKSFASKLEIFKRNIFGIRPDKPVIMHRSDIINRKGPFGLLRQMQKHELFNAGLIEIIEKTDFKLICVVIDKKRHMEAYSDPFHPYHYCMAAILDRFSGWLNYKNSVGDVMAESRGKEEDLQLKQAYLRVYESGTIMFSHSHHQRALTSRHIKIQPKIADIAGLQLADVLAYPVKQAILIEKELIPDQSGTFGKKVYESILDKFNRRGELGVIDGYGKVFLP